jgi:hypothetical protein
MPLVPVPAGKATMRDVADGLEVVIPAKRSAFIVLFLGFWLIGWACGEVFAAKELLNPRLPNSPDLFLLAWLGAWTVGGAFAIYTWVWAVSGRERVTLSPTVLTLSREVLRYGRSKDFDLAHVSNLRAAPQSFSPFDMSAGFQMWGLSGGPIAFDYGAKTFRFGASLDEAEARKVVSALASRNPAITRGGAA